MSENQSPQPEEQPPQAEQPVAQQPEEPQVPEAAPTDFRRNIYLLVIILAVVVVAWVISALTRAPAAGPKTPAARAPAAPAGQVRQGTSAQTAARKAPAGASTAPVNPVRIIGTDRTLITAIPPQIMQRGGKTYGLPQRTFDVTQAAPGFDWRTLRQIRWAGQAGVIGAVGKLQDIFQPAVTVDALQPTDRVVVLTVDKETHVYPVEELESVGGVLDLVGGRQVFVTWSPLTQLARCLDSKVGGKAVEWQDAGLVYRGNDVLFNGTSGALWDSFSGAGLTGSAVGKTAELLPVQVWTWQQWKKNHPTSNVLILPGFAPDKKLTQHIEAYLSSPVVPVPLEHAAGKGPVAPKAFVLGLAVGKASRAYDLGALFGAGKAKLKDSLGGKDFEVTVTSARTAVASSGGKPVDAPVMLYFGWKEAHPGTTVYSPPSPAAAPSAQPAAPTTPVK